MSEKNRRILLVIILIMTVVWAGYNYPFGSNGKRSEAAAVQAPLTPERTPAPGAAAPALDTLPEISEAQLAERDAQPWPRDPFYKRPARSAKQAKQVKRSYKLKAIIYNDTAPSAYLNGRIVRQGDRIGGATVTKITPNSVTLRIGQEYQKITLK